MRDVQDRAAPHAHWQREELVAGVLQADLVLASGQIQALEHAIKVIHDDSIYSRKLSFDWQLLHNKFPFFIN